MKAIQHAWVRHIFAGVIFSMVLVLTPRAFVDSDMLAGTTEIPVRALEQGDSCLWCTPQKPIGHCENGEPQIHWLNPDQVLPHQLPGACDEDIAEARDSRS